MYVLFPPVAVPPSFTTTPIDQTVQDGNEATFHCRATGNPTPTITWLKDGKTVGHGDNLNFNVSRNHSGKYWCTADNGLDVNINASALLDVQCKFIKTYLTYYCHLLLLFKCLSTVVKYNLKLFST